MSSLPVDETLDRETLVLTLKQDAQKIKPGPWGSSSNCYYDFIGPAMILFHLEYPHVVEEDLLKITREDYYKSYRFDGISISAVDYYIKMYQITPRFNPIKLDPYLFLTSEGKKISPQIFKRYISSHLKHTSIQCLSRFRKIYNITKPRKKKIANLPPFPSANDALDLCSYDHSEPSLPLQIYASQPQEDYPLISNQPCGLLEPLPEESIIEPGLDVEKGCTAENAITLDDDDDDDDSGNTLHSISLNLILRFLSLSSDLVSVGLREGPTYLILRDLVKINEISVPSINGDETIFNSFKESNSYFRKQKRNYPTGRRRIQYLDHAPAYLQNLINILTSAFIPLGAHLPPCGFSIITSDVSTVIQDPHIDYLSMLSGQKTVFVPLFIVVALGKCSIIIEGKVISLQMGEVLLGKGDLVHQGNGGFQGPRLHAFMETRQFEALASSQNGFINSNIFLQTGKLIPCGGSYCPDYDPPAIGFDNFGNTCYLNVLLHSLRFTQPLVEVVGNTARRLKNESTNLSLLNSFNDLLTYIGNKRIQDDVDLTNPLFLLYQNLLKIFPAYYLERDQHDVNDILDLVISQLQLECDQIHTKFIRSNIASNLEVNVHGVREIEELYRLKFCKTLKCLGCNRHSASEEIMLSLRLALKVPFGQFFNEDFECMCPENCGSNTVREQRFITSLPPILLIQYKRVTYLNEPKFKYSFRKRKIHSDDKPKFNVCQDDVPCDEWIDLKQFLQNGEDNSITTYLLYGIVIHHGESDLVSEITGHYTVYLRNVFNGVMENWYHFNDKKVNDYQSLENIPDRHKASMLFYRRMERN
jgi:ubiquitin C-terminal hydrolase